MNPDLVYFSNQQSITVDVLSYTDVRAQKVAPKCGSKHLFFLVSIDAEGNEERILNQIASGPPPYPKWIVYEHFRREMEYTMPGYKEVLKNRQNVILLRNSAN